MSLTSDGEYAYPSGVVRTLIASKLRTEGRLQAGLAALEELLDEVREHETRANAVLEFEARDGWTPVEDRLQAVLREMRE